MRVFRFLFYSGASLGCAISGTKAVAFLWESDPVSAVTIGAMTAYVGLIYAEQAFGVKE